MSYKWLSPIVVSVCLFLSAWSHARADSSYDRELVVKDQTRAMKVESVFKQLLMAYQDEEPGEFLKRVSEDRFRQDYITFTDALYSDFRLFEIHQVDFWIDRIVSDHIKQFLFVRWEKRFESLESGRQMTQEGVSRFLFDEVNGKYLLIELAGDPLFGGSLDEWLEEVPPVSGSGQNPQNGMNAKPDLTIVRASCTILETVTPARATVSIMVGNQGGKASEACTLTLTLDDSSTVTRLINGLAPNETYRFTEAFVIPNTLSARPASVMVDGDHAIMESNESNNKRSFALNIVKGEK